MSDPKYSQDQLNALLRFASKKLGMTPEALAKTLQNGNVSDLGKRLPPDKAAKLNGMTTDQKKQTEELLRSPEAQRLISQLLNKDGKVG